MKWFRQKLKRKLITPSKGGTRSAAPLEENPDKFQIVVKITGGLGDQVVLARVLRDLQNYCGNLEYHICVPHPEHADWVFGLTEEVKSIMHEELFETFRHHCDAVLYLNSFVCFHEQDFNFVKAQRLSPNLANFYAVCRKSRRPWNIFIGNHPVLDGAFARQCVALGYNRYSFIHNMLKLPYGGDRLALPVEESPALHETLLHYPEYITINTGFDHLFIISSDRATKCYPDRHWSTLVRLLKKCFPALGIIQIGGKNSTPIPEADLNFASKTTLAESAGILAQAKLHVDIEGGLVHVASALGVKSVVLFGPTSKSYFGYPDNINLRDENCPDCWWGTELWMEKCPQKKPESERCMSLLSPEKVFAAISKELSGSLKNGKAIINER